MTTVSINGAPFSTPADTLSFEQVTGLCGEGRGALVKWRTRGVSAEEALRTGVVQDHREGVLFPGHRVKIEEGMTFRCATAGAA